MAKKSEKYDAILQAAFQVISEKGFEKTSVADIVKEANIAKGTFYLYFDSKTALVPALSELVLWKTLTSIQEASKHLTSNEIMSIITIMIDVTFTITEKYRNIILLSYARLAFDHSFSKWELIYKPYYEWLENLLYENKNISPSMDNKNTSRIIINLIEQAAERFYFGGHEEMPIEIYKQEISNFIRRAISINES